MPPRSSFFALAISATWSRAGSASVGLSAWTLRSIYPTWVGVGEAMLEAYLDLERDDGVTLFDAHVTPGHRLTKNFFESKGFSARSILMHRTDEHHLERDKP